MEEVEVSVFTSLAGAGALAQFLRRLDHDALARYVHPDEKNLTEQALTEMREALQDTLGDTAKEVKVILYLNKARARALAQLVKRLDHDALVRYAHPADKQATIEALRELQEALKEAGFNPR